MLLLLLVSAFGQAFSLDIITRAFCTILSSEAWKTYTVITTAENAHIPCNTPSSLSTAMIFTVHDMNDENVTDSLELDSIYKLHQEKYLNVLVMCSANCIIELLCQAQQVERDIMKEDKQVVSRWLVIPTSGAVKDIARTRKTIKTNRLIILESTIIHHSWHNMSKGNFFSFIDLYLMNGQKNKRELHALGALRNKEWSLIEDTLYAKDKHGFQNKSLTVAVAESPPFVIRSEMNGSVTYSGACIDLLHELARRLNFSYTIVEPEDGEFGNLVDGKWTGLVGQLVDKEVDLVAAPIAITKSRAEVMDFTVPYFYFKTGIIIRTPSATPLLTLISPFHYKVHMCLAIALVLSTTFVLTLEVLTSKCFLHRLVDKLRHYGNIAFGIFGSVVLQGGDYTPSMASSRILLSAWLLFTVILSATYTGNLIASITGGRRIPPFSTLAELARQGTYKWGFDGGSNYLALFRDSNLSDYQAIWQGIQNNRDEDTDVMSIDNDVHLRRVLQGHYAYIGEETNFDQWKGKSCDLQMVEHEFDLLHVALGLPENSTNTKIFSNEVSVIFESGLPRLWYNRWKPTVQCEIQKRPPYSIGLQELQSIFYVAGVGVVMAGVVLVVEILYSRKCEKTRNSESHSTRSSGLELVPVSTGDQLFSELTLN